MNYNNIFKNRSILKIIYLIRSILYLPFLVLLFAGNFYSRVIKIIDRRNHDTFWLEIMQGSIDANKSRKIKISSDKEIKFYCPSKIASFRAKTFFTKEPETIEWMNRYGSEKKILYDIGANMGIYTIYYAKKFKTKVYAFEPSFKNLDLLVKNIKLNLLEKEVSLIPNPLCDKSLIANFFQLRSSGGDSVSTFNDEKTKKIFLSNKNPKNNNPVQYNILGLSLDNLIELNLIKPPDLIKLDVDGNEVEIINGFKKSIQKIDKISMLIETGTTTSKDNLEEELTNCGLKKLISSMLIQFGKNKFEMINYITAPFKWFFKLEAASGLLLLIAAVVALILSNTNLSDLYFGVLNTYILIGTQNFGLNLSVLHWINDALMAVFFFIVTLEIKREFIHGELSKPKQAFLPIIGAIGGMVLPAIIYVIINFKTGYTLRGWAIPTATDIAFSIGVLSLLGTRIPISLKVFLTALAIIDDLGAIIIIAFFYSTELQYTYLLLMLATFIALLTLNKLGVKKFAPYFFVGLFLWYFTHGSGIHSTISGVILAATIPHREHEKDYSLLLKLEHILSPYVAFGIMPLFALANAGVILKDVSINTILTPVPLGILCGLFFGKQIGVFLFSFLSIKLKLAEMPSNSNWIKLYGVGILTGIGFTMSLFVGNLAFADYSNNLNGVKIGVLIGSFLSAVVGYFILLTATKKK